MKRLIKVAKVTFVVLFSYLSVLNVGLFNVGSVHAADCSSPGPEHHLSLYSVSGSSLEKPATSIDPQNIVVGQRSLKYVVQLEDVNNCPTNATSATPIELTMSATAGQFLSSSGTPLATNNVTISTGTARRSFLVKGTAVANPLILSATYASLTVPSTTQSLFVSAPSPNVAKINSINNPHGTSDAIAGVAGAVAAPSAPFDGITVRAYTPDGLTVLGSSVASADGSFAAITTGDDMYRHVLVRAEYPGGVLSNASIVDQNLPALVSNLTVTHPLNDRPLLTWTGLAGASYRIYRAPAAVTINETHFIGTSSTVNFVDTTPEFALGTTYRYAVKPVVAGSFAPEFMPVLNVRFDVSMVQMQTTGNYSVSTPGVTFIVTPTLLTAFQTTPSAIQVKYIGASGTFFATTSVISGTSLKAQAPFVDAQGTQWFTLPNGSFNVEITGTDVVAGISDKVVVVNNYTVASVITASATTTVPNAPIVSKIRYSNGSLLGIEGSVTPNHYVEIFTSQPNSSSSPSTTVLANAGGAFSLTIAPPANGFFYLIARDAQGNKSAATTFDVRATLAVASPTNFVAVPSDGKVTVSWNAVSGASNYEVQVYDTRNNALIKTATANSSQTSLTFELQNRVRYVFRIAAVDKFGNRSSAIDVTTTPRSRRVASAVKNSSLAQQKGGGMTDVPQSSTLPTSNTTDKPTEQPTSGETVVPTPPGAPDQQDRENDVKDWTKWIIGAGILILAIALLAAYLLWGQPSETIVTTTRRNAASTPAKPVDNTKPTKAADRAGPDKKEPPKPRW